MGNGAYGGKLHILNQVGNSRETGTTDVNGLIRQGALQLATYYGDHMVLQRGPKRAVVWGTASKNGDTGSRGSGVTGHRTGPRRQQSSRSCYVIAKLTHVDSSARLENDRVTAVSAHTKET
ncbi:hypothetical protein C0Q70_10706 [Pomacea canaliculata]|uniref:Uncharacterized protein n=1 Tax=Pomacea canaliculata TaxID=400727 RepID=A0A2T7P3X7_POMCA|nr:hypothetical protein C0Q70_10706 [Pomacea canaliculata]